MPVLIMGKAYKPDVDILDGSYSLLIGHYLEKQGTDFAYVDPLTNDTATDIDQPVIAFLAHNRQVTYGYTGTKKRQEFYCDIAPGSIIVDPWRTYPKIDNNYKVIHYGNTRFKTV